MATIKRAVVAEQAGDWAEAHRLYAAGVELLLPLVDAEADKTRRASLSARVSTCKDSASPTLSLPLPLPVYARRHP